MITAKAIDDHILDLAFILEDREKRGVSFSDLNDKTESMITVWCRRALELREKYFKALSSQQMSAYVALVRSVRLPTERTAKQIRNSVWTSPTDALSGVLARALAVMEFIRQDMTARSFPGRGRYITIHLDDMAFRSKE